MVSLQPEDNRWDCKTLFSEKVMIITAFNLKSGENDSEIDSV